MSKYTVISTNPAVAALIIRNTHKLLISLSLLGKGHAARLGSDRKGKVLSKAEKLARLARLRAEANGEDPQARPTTGNSESHTRK